MVTENLKEPTHNSRMERDTKIQNDFTSFEMSFSAIV